VRRRIPFSTRIGSQRLCDPRTEDRTRGGLRRWRTIVRSCCVVPITRMTTHPDRRRAPAAACAASHGAGQRRRVDAVPGHHAVEVAARARSGIPARRVPGAGIRTRTIRRSDSTTMPAGEHLGRGQWDRRGRALTHQHGYKARPDRPTHVVLCRQVSSEQRERETTVRSVSSRHREYQGVRGQSVGTRHADVGRSLDHLHACQPP
jgi:hypothetical protein